MSNTDWLRKLVYQEITKMFTYGVDWTEARDTSPNDHDVSTFAAMIKDDFAKSITNDLTAQILDHINKAIGEDEALVEYDIIDDCMYPVSGAKSRNKLRAEIRKELGQ